MPRNRRKNPHPPETPQSSSLHPRRSEKRGRARPGRTPALKTPLCLSEDRGIGKLEEGLASPQLDRFFNHAAREIFHRFRDRLVFADRAGTRQEKCGISYEIRVTPKYFVVHGLSDRHVHDEV